MSWNYRIVQYLDDGGYGLHEVHYNNDGKEESMTNQPAAFVGDSPETIREALMLARRDASARPVFIEPAEWGKLVANETESGAAAVGGI